MIHRFYQPVSDVIRDDGAFSCIVLLLNKVGDCKGPTESSLTPSSVRTGISLDAGQEKANPKSEVTRGGGGPKPHEKQEM